MARHKLPYNTFFSIYAACLTLLFTSACSVEDSGKNNSLIISLFNTKSKAAIARTGKIAGYNNLFNIVHISDSHISSWSQGNYPEFPYNLYEAVYFANQAEVSTDAILITGDNISNTAETTTAEAIDYHKSFTKWANTDNHVPTLFCLGNHDPNIFAGDSTNALNKQTLHNLYFGSNNMMLNQPEGENYFYKDLPNPKGGTFRIISLDCTDQDNCKHNSLQMSLFSQKQTDWLANVALKQGMTDNHHIVIMHHFPLQPYSSDRSTYLTSGSFLFGYQMIPEIVEAFRKREILAKNYNSCTDSSSISVDIDFSNASGNFVCYVGGHAHTTGLIHIDGLCNQATNLNKQIMLLVSTQVPALESTGFSLLFREQSDLDANNFNIYSIDTEGKAIYSTYFGKGAPKYHSSGADVQQISY